MIDVSIKYYFKMERRGEGGASANFLGEWCTVAIPDHPILKIIPR